MRPLLRGLRSVGRVIILVIALVYFVIDALFLRLVRPLRQRFMRLAVVKRTRAWVRTLHPYPSLCLLLVPWVILEPIKPIGLILFHRHHHLAGTLVFIIGELLKLAIFDQLFEMTKPKLMTLHWFAWCYNTWHSAIVYIRSLPFWRMIREQIRSIWRRVTSITRAIDNPE